MTIECFWLDETDRQRRCLRRYVEGPCPGQPGEYSYHDARVRIEDGPIIYVERDGVRYHGSPPLEEHVDDERWPTKCDQCDYAFADGDTCQAFGVTIMRRADNGEETTILEAAPGAMWDAWWMPDSFKGPDGLCVMAKCPDGHQWMIDGEASNCTRKGDRSHHCWIRHGTPPKLTVDKNGETCAAGAGSIATPGYHGFLIDGRFT